MIFVSFGAVSTLKTRQIDEKLIDLAHYNLPFWILSSIFANIKCVNMSELIGRNAERVLLEQYIESPKSEFIAIYGRRRVGKTYLITETFKNRLTFDMTGVLEGDKEDQMSSFFLSLQKAGYGGAKPNTWIEAFEALKIVLAPALAKGNAIIFIDELPCLDTPRSGLVKALDLFWNGWANRQKNIKLIVCGSATTWMVDNIIDNHGGLHDRITHELHLHPFTLGETEEYLKSNGFRWNRLSIAQAYMILGGIPYYLSLLDKGQSLTENIDRLFFSTDAELHREYDRLFKSLFRNPQPYVKIIQLLSSNRKGLTRNEISEKLGKETGGHLSKMLENLENCDFIRKYCVREKKINSKNGIYQLVDFFTRFHNDFCVKGTTDDHYWSNTLNTPKQNTWYGLAFERLCQAHIPQIKRALGIDRIHTEYYSWRSKESKPAAQVDLVIERADQITNLCEIKYSRAEYSIDSEENAKLQNRVADFERETGTRSAVNLTFITTFGLKPNAYSSDIHYRVQLDALFDEVRPR